MAPGYVNFPSPNRPCQVVVERVSDSIQVAQDLQVLDGLAESHEVDGFLEEVAGAILE